MRDTRLILVDGMGGAGKSTAAQHLAIQMNLQSIPARWYHEDESENPVKAFYRPEQHASAAAFGAQVLTQWDRLVESVQAGSGLRYVVEGCFFQGPLVGLLLADADRAAMTGLIDGIAGRVGPVGGCLLYLRPGDVAGTLTRACAGRYGSLEAEYIARSETSTYGRAHGLTGFAGLVRFWEAVQEIADAAFAAFTGPKVQCDPSKLTLAECHATLLRFLKLEPQPIPGLTPAAAARYTGLYARRAAAAAAPIAVRYEAGQLVVAGLAPFLWDAGNRLIPAGPDVFHAAGWPTRVIFEPDGDGRIAGLRLETTERGWRRTDERFPKMG